jgi:hypothetical protein
MPDDDCYGVPLSSFLPTFITDELFRYCRDFRHLTRWELGQISPETQIKIADTLRSQFDPTHMTYGKPFTPSIPLPIGLLDLPGDLSLRVWPKEWGDLGRGVNEVHVNYELYRF